MLMIRAAWSILLGHCTVTDDIVFGAAFIGPQVSVYDCDLISGGIQNLVYSPEAEAEAGTATVATLVCHV